MDARTVVSKLGGVPFCLCPFGSPHPDRAAFVWSTHSCGLVVAWAGSSLPLPVFFLPQGCSLSLRPGLPPALSPTLCSGIGRLQLWFWGGAFSPPGSEVLSIAPMGLWVRSLGVRSWGHCPALQRPLFPPPRTWPILGLGLSSCPFCLVFSHC